MSEQRFDIFFRGEARDGAEISQVKANFVQLFKAPAEKIEPLFSGKSIPLKKNLDRASAIKMQNALKKAGAKVYIKATGAPATTAAATQTPPAETTHTEPTPTTPTPARPDQTEHATDQELDMLPPGSDILTEDEREVVEVPDIDISNIKLASVFDSTEIPSEAPPPVPDVSHITTADVGADILEGFESPPPPPAPDVEYLSMGEVGEDLVEAKEEVPIPTPDVDFITLAEPGEDIDPNPKEPPPAAPDVSHITLNQ